MEDEAVIEAGVGQRDEVLDALRSNLRVEFHDDGAAALHGDGGDGMGFVHGGILLSLGRIRISVRLALGAGQGQQHQGRQQQYDRFFHSLVLSLRVVPGQISSWFAGADGSSISFSPKASVTISRKLLTTWER